MASIREIVDEFDRELERRKQREVDGHTIAKVEWETPNTIVFRDPEGNLWRRVHRWGMTWPITVNGSQKG